MMVQLTKAAREALIAVGTRRQGATINTVTPGPVADELRNAGLIGPGNGLTRRGTIVRERLLDAALDAAF